MYLNIFLVVLILLGIVLLTKKIKNYTVVYLLLIILIFLAVKKLCQDQKEYFENIEDIQKQLQESVEQEASEKAMRGRINDLETTVSDLKEVLKKQTIKNSMIRDGESRNFSLEESQKKQDSNLESLENELDILLRLYRKENESNDEVKYKTLPIYSSCKVNDMGEFYKRDMDVEQEKREKIIEQLERDELGKNLGIQSESSKALLGNVNQHINKGAGNVDININLE